MLLGLSQACYLPAALALISELHAPGSRLLATNFHQSGLYAGMAQAGGMGGWLGDQHGWRSPFLIFGALGLLYVLLLERGLRKEEPRAAEGAVPLRNPLTALLEVARRPGYRGMLTAFAGFSAAN